MHRHSADDYKSVAYDNGLLPDDYIPTVSLALESTDSKQETPDSNINSSVDPAKMGVWVHAGLTYHKS